MVLEAFHKRGRKFVGVCSYGRSGSSFLMEFLRAAGLSVIGELPYEDRTNQAVFLALNRLSSGAPAPDTPRPEAPIFENHQGILYRSCFDLTARNAGELQRKHADYMDRTFPTGEEAAIGVAEKFIGFDVLQKIAASDTQSVFKPVFLVRDPRDVFISVKKFNEKRGMKGFNDTENGDDRLMRIICDFERVQLMEAERCKGFVCHYEDLIARRPQTVVGLLTYLGIAIPSAEVVARIWRQLKIEAAGRNHMTSASQASSIGRWRKAEFRPYRGVFEAHYSRVLQLGYL